MDSMRRNAQKMMPHVMALNKKPTMGMKNDRQPAPAVSKLVAYAKGGKVMAKGGAADKKQDKSMLARHNRLMHPSQKSKLMNGGMVKKYADGEAVNPFAKKFEKERDEPVKSLKGEEPKKALKEKSVDMSKRVGQGKMPKMMNGGMMKGYGMGGKPMFKKGGKVKGDKKKVMGTVGEAKAVMAALQKARRPATPMPGTRMAGLGMAPPMAPQMAPPMKKGGKVMKKAAGGAAKLRRKSPMPDKIKMVNYPRGG
jgi:hypothetical protein